MATPAPTPLEGQTSTPALDRSKSGTALYTFQLANPPHVHQSLPNTPFAISLIAFVLGTVFSPSLILGLRVLGVSAWEWVGEHGSGGQLALYFAVLSWFHLWEFLSTAGWGPSKLSVDSYLLNNGYDYAFAHVFGLATHLIIMYLFPSLRQTGWWTILGLLFVVLGQVLRTLAMVHASESFSHLVALQKKQDHVLVTTGVYSYWRHPSYFGFFYWAIGTQLLLSNPIGASAFAIVLWRFFSHRIKVEEVYLVKFFGKDYVAYRERVRTWIPLIH